MGNWCVWLYQPTDNWQERYFHHESAWRLIHNVPAETSGDALHKAKNFFAKRQRKDPNYFPRCAMEDVAVMDARLYVTGIFEIDSVGKGREDAQPESAG